MKITLGQSYSFQQQGQRDYQEDSRFPNMDKPTLKQRFFVVCDGVGGCEKGEVASQTVCDAIAKAMENVEYGIEFTNSDFSVVLDAAYDALDRKANRSNRDMATTLTFAYFHEGGCTLAHIGDSRIYHFRKGKGIIYRSEDHSLVNSMVHNGMITPEEGVNSSQKHVITRYMEPVDSDQNRCMATVLNTKDVRKGDYIMLCTDGVCNQVDDDEMADILFNSEMSDENKMSMIAQMCIDSDDNNTAILIPIINVVTDIKSAEPAYSNEGTKKIPFPGESTIVEIESTQHQKGNRLLNWIKELFN